MMAGVATSLLRWHAQTCRLGRVRQGRNGAWAERKRYRSPLASGQKTELQPIPSQAFNAGKYAPYVGDDVRIDIAIEAQAK